MLAEDAGGDGEPAGVGAFRGDAPLGVDVDRRVDADVDGLAGFNVDFADAPGG